MSNFIPVFSVIAATLIQLSTQDKQLLECFDRSASRAVSNQQPLANLFKVTPYDCMHFCLQQVGNRGETCQQIVYHRKYWSCSLYEASNGGAVNSGGDTAGFSVPAIGHDLYTRTSNTGNCLSPNRPRVTNPPTPRPTTRERRIQTTEEFVDITTTPQSPFTAGPSTDCGVQDALTAYLVAPGYEFGSDDIEPIILDDAEETFCFIACTDTVGPDGEDIPCLSYAYRPASRTCELYPGRSEPDGIVPLRTAPNSIYAQKICLPDPPEICAQDELFLHFPGRSLDGVEPEDLIGGEEILDGQNGQGEEILDGGQGRVFGGEGEFLDGRGRLGRRRRRRQIQEQLDGRTRRGRNDNDRTAGGNLIVSNTNSLEECVQLCALNSQGGDVCKSVTYSSISGECIQHDRNGFDGVRPRQAGPEFHYVENGCLTNTQRRKKQAAFKASQTGKQQQSGSVFKNQTAPVLKIPKQAPQPSEILQLIPGQPAPSIKTNSLEGEWNEWSSCQFKVKKQDLRVRTRQCNLFSCPPGSLQIQRCSEVFGAGNSTPNTNPIFRI